MQRAARARRRADEAQLRISQLRDRRTDGVVPSPSRHEDDLSSARAHAQEAHDHLLSALESSAAAHERASIQFSKRARGDSELETKAKDHLDWAAADRARAGDLRKP